MLPNAYPLLAQSKIVASLQGCTNISIFDVASFFYKWRVYPDYRHMLTMVIHHSQEIYNVLVMRCKNSVAYVQRSIDNILRSLKNFVRAYINDIDSGACFFTWHVIDLQAIFDLCIQYNISIKPTKVFFNYPSVNLLGQHVNFLDLTTAEDKLATIAAINYPVMPKDLEHFLGLTSYLHSSVHCYAQIATPF